MVFQVDKLEKYTFFTSWRLEKISKSQQKKCEFKILNCCWTLCTVQKYRGFLFVCCYSSY